MGAAKVGTLPLSTRPALTRVFPFFLQVWSLVCASPTSIDTRPCVHYDVVLSFATLISRVQSNDLRVWRANGHRSRRDHMTNASLRGNQLVSNRFLVPPVPVTVWFPIQLSSPTTPLRVCARQHVESNQLRTLVGLHQVSNVWDNNIFNIINIRPTFIAINKIHLQPIFFPLRYVFKPTYAGYMRDLPNGCGNATILSSPQTPCSIAPVLCIGSNKANPCPGSSRTPSEDETGSEGHMRRITVSPPVSPRTSVFDTYNYSDADSVSDAAEVEAALAMIDNELANTEDAVTEWSSRESNVSGPTSYSGRTGYTSRTGYTGTTGFSGETGYSEQTGYTGQTGQTGYTGPTYSTFSPSNSEVGSYSSNSGSGTGSQARSYTTGSYGGGSHLSTDVFSPHSGPVEPHRLSTITERTENPSRPTSFQPSAGNRNSGLSADTNRRSTHSSHLRAATDPTERVASPVSVPKRTGQLIAFFEEKTSDKPSIHARSISVPSGPRSPSPFTPAYGYNPRTTPRSTSPTKPRTTVNTERLPVGDYNDYTPSAYTQTQTGVTGTYTAARTQGSYTTTTSSGSNSGGSGNFSGFSDSYNTSSTATPASTLRRPAANRSPLSTVRNTINAWKESKPTKRDENSTDSEDGLFSIRRRADRGSIRLRDHASRGPRDAHSEPVERELPTTPKTGTGTTGGLLPPPFDVSELGNYANPGGDQEVCWPNVLSQTLISNVPNSL